MDQQRELLQGPLDMLILKAVSLGRCAATAFCYAFNRFQKIVGKFSRALCIPPSIALNTGVGSRVNAASRKTIKRRSITTSPRPASVGCKAEAEKWNRMADVIGGNPGYHI